MTLCVSMKLYVLYVVKINMFMLGTFVSNGLHFDDAKSSCVVLITSRTWRSFSITPAFSRSRPINCQFKTNHSQILIILSSRPFMAPIWGLGIAIIDQEWRLSTYFRVQVPSFIMAPNMVGFGHCKYRAQLLSPEIRMKFFHCRCHLIGVMFHKDNPNRVNPIFYIWFARRHFYLPHKSPQCSKVVNKMVYYCYIGVPNGDTWMVGNSLDFSFLVVWLSHLETLLCTSPPQNFLDKGLQDDIFFHPTPNSCGI